MQLTEVKEILFWVWKGKSIARARMNFLLNRQVDIKGRILDLGGGANPSYKSLVSNNLCEWVTTDIIPENNPTVICDLEKPLPFNDSEFDIVIVCNLLEHIYNYQQLVDEIYRVIKTGGNCYVMVPFLVSIHADPFDYFRYTSASLKRIFLTSRFSEVNIQSLGGIFQSAVNILFPIIKFRSLKFLVTGIALYLDFLLQNMKGKIYEDKYTLMYYVKVKK